MRLSRLINWIKRLGRKKITLPTEEGHLLFKVEGLEFEYTVEKSSILESSILTGGNEGEGGLYVTMYHYKSPFHIRARWDATTNRYQDNGWGISLLLNSGTSNLLRARYQVERFEDLPPEIYALVSQISRACWKTLEEREELKKFVNAQNRELEKMAADYKQRLDKIAEAERQSVLKELSGTNAMISPNPLIRLVGQEGWKRDRIKNRKKG